MLGKIHFEQYEKCYPKRLKNFFRSNINYTTYDKFIPNMKTATVGNLPPEIINLFKSDKKEKIKIFQNALSEAAIYIRTHKNYMNNENLSVPKRFDERKVKSFEQNITYSFNEKVKSIMPKDTRVEFKYAKSGGFAHVFKISILNKESKKLMHDKAFKVFYYIQEPIALNCPYHNNYAEANFWTYIKYRAGHKMDNTKFTRHYISDMKSGYYMTEFIDKDIHKTTSPLSLALFGIKFMDWEHNDLILGKMYDGGGFKKKKVFIDDKIVLRYFKKIVNRTSAKEQLKVLANQEKLTENPKTPHRDKIIKANKIYKKYRTQLEIYRQTHKKKSTTNRINKILSFFKDKQLKLINYFNNKRP